jgi:DtxR family Mn-dependent transcriptional regulator
MPTQAVEDYVKAIYKLESLARPVSTNDLAEKTGTTPAAVTKMLKHLAGLRLVVYTPYYGVYLTEAGTRVALEVIRHHRLIELYLHQAMGYSWDQVDAEADQLEHVISEEFEAKIDALLGHPTFCPHGDPIPTADGMLVETRLQCLNECSAGDAVLIARVRDTKADILRDLAAKRMTLSAEILVLDRNASDNSLTIQIAGKRHEIDSSLAASVFVSPKLEIEAVS